MSYSTLIHVDDVCHSFTLFGRLVTHSKLKTLVIDFCANQRSSCPDANFSKTNAELNSDNVIKSTQYTSISTFFVAT